MTVPNIFPAHFGKMVKRPSAHLLLLPLVTAILVSAAGSGQPLPEQFGALPHVIVHLRGKSYNLTKFVADHPGGPEVLRAANGLDVEEYLAGHRCLLGICHSHRYAYQVLGQFGVEGRVEVPPNGTQRRVPLPSDNTAATPAAKAVRPRPEPSAVPNPLSHDNGHLQQLPLDKQPHQHAPQRQTQAFSIEQDTLPFDEQKHNTFSGESEIRRSPIAHKAAASSPNARPADQEIGCLFVKRSSEFPHFYECA